MKSYSASTRIRATPKRIWEILTDAASYPEWNPEVVRIDGRIAEGEEMTVHIHVAPRNIDVRVAALVTEGPDQRMVWTGGLPGGLLRGERSFTVKPSGDTDVEVTIALSFSGAMAPILTKSIPDQQPILEAVAAGLKRRAEQG